MTHLVGLTGHAGSGKDSVAAVLVERHGFVRYALADAVREAVLLLDPKVAVGIRVSDVVTAVGWDGAKRAHPEIRRLLQVMGTEVGRGLFGEDCWTDRFRDWQEARPASTRVVITDVRFPNEAKMVDQRGGQIWHVRRPDVGPVNGHASDAGLAIQVDDIVVHNNGTLEQLADAVSETWLRIEAEWRA